MENFVLEIEDVDGEIEHGSWREYMISSRSPPRSVRLICPAGVAEADFAKRVQLAVAALNDVKPIDRPELPPDWIDDPWVDFADAQMRRAEAAERSIAMLTAERDALARQLERTQSMRFELEAQRDEERQLVRVGAEILKAAPLLVLDEDDVAIWNEDDVAIWEVLRDGTSTPTAFSGYITGDQRGLVALHFAQDDGSGWLDGQCQYNELLWVRRCKPDPEREPGQAFRVSVLRDPEAEREP